MDIFHEQIFHNHRQLRFSNFKFLPNFSISKTPKGSLIINTFIRVCAFEFDVNIYMRLSLVVIDSITNKLTTSVEMSL